MQRDDTNKIHVRNIPIGTSEVELRDHFSRAGEIVDFILKPADATHMWAFIGFSNAADFQVALEMNNQEFKESILEVTPKTQPPPRERRVDDRRCFRCNKTGHISTKCPTGVERKCFKCGRAGHMAHACPDGGRRARSRSNDRDRSRSRDRRRRREDSRDRRRDDSRDRRRRDDSRDRRRDDSRDRRRRDDRDDRRRDDRRRDDRRDDRRRDDRRDDRRREERREEQQ